MLHLDDDDDDSRCCCRPSDLRDDFGGGGLLLPDPRPSDVTFISSRYLDDDIIGFHLSQRDSKAQFPFP